MFCLKNKFCFGAQQIQHNRPKDSLKYNGGVNITQYSLFEQQNFETRPRYALP